MVVIGQIISLFGNAILRFALPLYLLNETGSAALFGAMFILYGVQGAYQPAVQASIPALLAEEHIMKGNAVINLVSSFSGLIGPVIGGALFAFYGIMPILYVSVVCFMLSAIMEIFIQIPYEKSQHREIFFQLVFLI